MALEHTPKSRPVRHLHRGTPTPEKDPERRTARGKISR